VDLDVELEFKMACSFSDSLRFRSALIEALVSTLEEVEVEADFGLVDHDEDDKVPCPLLDFLGAILKRLMVGEERRK